MGVRIVTDSTSDLPPQLCRELGVTVVPLTVNFGDKEYRDGVDLSAEEFYQALQYVGAPTVMLRFQGEWHGTSSKPSNFMRTQLYLRKWFAKWGTHGERMTS